MPPREECWKGRSYVQGEGQAEAHARFSHHAILPATHGTSARGTPEDCCSEQLDSMFAQSLPCPCSAWPGRFLAASHTRSLRERVACTWLCCSEDCHATATLSKKGHNGEPWASIWSWRVSTWPWGTSPLWVFYFLLMCTIGMGVGGVKAQACSAAALLGALSLSRLCVCVSLYLPLCLCLSPSISFCVSLSLSLCLSASVSISFCLFLCLSLPPSVSLCFSVSVSLFLSLSLCLCISVSLPLPTHCVSEKGLEQ